MLLGHNLSHASHGRHQNKPAEAVIGLWPCRAGSTANRSRAATGLLGDPTLAVKGAKGRGAPRTRWTQGASRPWGSVPALPPKCHRTNDPKIRGTFGIQDPSDPWPLGPRDKDVRCADAKLSKGRGSFVPPMGRRLPPMANECHQSQCSATNHNGLPAVKMGCPTAGGARVTVQPCSSTDPAGVLATPAVPADRQWRAHGRGLM